VNEDELYTLERSLNPLQGYSLVWLTGENKKNLTSNKLKFYKDFKDSYDKIGYEMVGTSMQMKKEDMDKLMKLIVVPNKPKEHQ
jgi:hypothetical protein